MQLVYRYECKPPRGEMLSYLEDQIHLAHRYYNLRIEQERELYADLEQLEATFSPDLQTATHERDQHQAAIDALYDQIRERNRKARSKTEPTDEEREQLASLRSLRKAASIRMRELRGAVRKLPEFQARKAERLQAYYDTKKQLYNEHNQLWWGCRSKEEQSVESAVRSSKFGPPRFKPWDRAGQVACQIQKGITVEKLFACEDTRLQAEPLPTQRTGRSARPYCFRVRVGSIGRSPRFAELYTYYHRPLPADARIMWAALVRTPGPKYRQADGSWKHNDRWSVQLTIRTDQIKTRAGSGMVGVDLGWRILPDGSLRVARWAGSDGQVGELQLPPLLLARWDKCRDLQAIRDLRFNEAIDTLEKFFKSDVAIPEWLALETVTLGQWRSHGRLCRLIDNWQRFAGDEMIYLQLVAWRDQEAHLEQYQHYNLAKAEAIRKDLYRNFARQLAKQYETVFVEDCDLSQLQRTPTPDRKEEYGVRRYAGQAASGLLRSTLSEGGALVVSVPSEHTTKICHACGSAEEFDRVRLWHTCSACSLPWDQDDNAARNILAKGSGAVKTPGPARGTDDGAVPAVASSTEAGGRWKRRKELARSKFEPQSKD